MNLKTVRIGRHHLQNGSRPLHIGTVFREKGSKGKNLIAWLRNGTERVRQRSGGS